MSFSPHFFSPNAFSAYVPIITNEDTEFLKEFANELMDEKNEIFDKISNEYERYYESLCILSQRFYDKLEMLTDFNIDFSIIFLKLLKYISEKFFS